MVWEVVRHFAIQSCFGTSGTPGSNPADPIASKLREVNGSVIGGHDTLVAYYMTTGEVLVENVELTD
jgi:hypothetical protein